MPDSGLGESQNGQGLRASHNSIVEQLEVNIEEHIQLEYIEGEWATESQQL